MAAATTEVQTAAFTKFYISNAVAASTIDSESEFEALTWVQVRPVSSIGEIGDMSESVEATSLEDNRKQRLPGLNDAGELPVTVNFKASDVGQIAMRAAAVASNQQYAFKIELNDAPDDNDTNTCIYFLGRVTSARLTGLQVNSVTQMVFNCPVNTAPLYVLAEAIA